MKLENDCIYVLRYTPYNMIMVYDGSEVVQIGNKGDFYPQCHGLYKYKGIELGDWHGANDLAKRVAKGQNKMVISRRLNRKEYDEVCGIH